jgi:hypothetical protein
VAVGALASALAGGWSASVAGVPISMNRPHKALTTALWLFVFSMLLDPRLAALWRRRTTGLFYFVAACLMFIFALGPLPHAFGVPLLYRVTPYSALMELPGGDSLRVPARFAMLMMLCLSQAAALAFARWSDARGLARSGRSRALAAALVLLIALDGWVPVLKTDSTPPAVDLTEIDTSAPVLELPIRDLFSDTRAMLRATSHGHALINGYSGYEPEPYVRLRDALRRHEAAAFDDLRPLGPLLVIVNAEWDPDGREREFVSGLAGARLVRNVEGAAVYVIE